MKTAEQAIAEIDHEDYEPYGSEWKREMAKLTKAQIIEITAGIGEENDQLKKMNEQ